MKHYGLNMTIREFYRKYEVWEIYNMIIYISNENENIRRANKKGQKKDSTKSSNMLDFILGD